MFSPDNPFAPAVDVPVSAPDPEPGTVERERDAVEEWKTAGNTAAPEQDTGEPAGVDLDALAALFENTGPLDVDMIERVVAVVAESIVKSANMSNDLDPLLTAVTTAKAVKDTTTDAYNDVRTRLWRLTGKGDHATPDGRMFTFRAPSESRRVDYKVLGTEYPDVYDAVVTRVKPKADSAGTLTLKKGNKSGVKK